MGKHSKHSNSAPIYTYHERTHKGPWGVNKGPLAHQEGFWGTHKQRVEGDNLKPFDYCSLCLHPVVNPLVCTKGHLYCKECIYQSMLEQKKTIDRQTKMYEKQQQELQAEAEAKQTEKKVKDVQSFDKTVLGFAAAKPASSSTEKPKEKLLPSYWVPGVREDDVKDLLKKPDTTTVCPEGNHPLRLKQLVPVNFTVIENATLGPSDTGRYMCPVCTKTLSNSLNLICLSACGHVMCVGCHAKTKGEKACIVCSKPFRDKDIINFESAGTSYSSKLGDKAMAKKEELVQLV